MPGRHSAERPARRTSAGSVLGRVLSGLLTLALVAGVAAFLALGVGPHVFGYRTATMLTGSMAGTIDPGDVIVSVPRPASEVEVGDVLTFRAPVPDKHVETHRVIGVRHTTDGRTVIRTKGDANEAADPWRATVQGDTVWQTVHVVPVVGTVVRALRAPVVRHGVFWGALAGLLLLGTSLIWSRTSDSDVLDGAALGQLADDVDDAAFAATFAARFKQMLPQRLGRISTALSTADLGSALDASLSLKVSSSTVGARELQELASVIELNVRRRDLAGARDAADDLARAARRADRALASYLADSRAA